MGDNHNARKLLFTDLVNTKTTVPLRVGEQREMYTWTIRVSIYITTAIHLPFGG